MKSVILAVCSFAGFVAWMLLGPAVPQSPAYHHMADQRAIFGVPNGLNVLSNLPFALVGAVGLVSALAPRAGRTPFWSSWERWPAAALFGGITLVAFGSAYYHLAPDNERLLWDRLPMSIGFMGLLTMVVGERTSVRLARMLFAPSLALGAGSVLYWYGSELAGAGDLRPYGLVQFGSLATVLALLAIRRSSYPGSNYLLIALAAYAAAKVFELADAEIYALGHVVSGHTLKHLAAAGGAASLVVMLRARKASTPIAEADTLHRVEPARLSPSVRVH